MDISLSCVIVITVTANCVFGVYSIPSPMRGSTYAAPHTRGFCCKSFLNNFGNLVNFLVNFFAEKLSQSP